MKILILTNKVPFPATDGSSIAMGSIAKALLHVQAEVHMLSLNTRKHFKQPKAIKTALPEGLTFDAVEANTNITPLNTFLNLLGNKAFHLSRFYQKDFAQKLIKTLEQQEFNWIQLDGLPMLVYLDLIRQHSTAKVSLRAHNVEHRIWEQHVLNEQNPLKKHYLQLQVKRLKQVELKALDQIDALIPITAVDQKHFEELGYTGPSQLIPCGIETTDYTLPQNNAPQYDIAYLASMDWMPNLSGVDWFINKVYPLLKEAKPNIRIALAGYEMPQRLLDKSDDNLHIEGAVENKYHFLANAHLCMVPLLAGSGMRIKVLEYLAMGKCIVSTAIGAEGIKVQHGEHMLLADTPKDFSQQLLWALDHPAQAETIGEKARTFAHANFDNAALGTQLLHFYQHT